MGDRSYYVSLDGDDDRNDGSAWGHAFATIAAARATLGTDQSTIYVGPGNHEITNLTLLDGQYIEGVGRGTILTSDAPGWAVTLAGYSAGLRKMKLVVGTTPDGALLHREGAFFCRSSELSVEAPVRTPGQVGIRWQQTEPEGGCYWNRVVESVVNNLSIHLQTIYEGPFGANVNAFHGNLYQADTCIELNGSTTGFEFIGSGDTFQGGLGVAINDTANRNWIQGRFEGGPGSKSYRLGPGTFENHVTMDTNCPIGGTDESIHRTNYVFSLGDGRAKPWAIPNDFVPLGNPNADSSADATLDGSAGVVGYLPFMVTQPIDAKKINVGIGTPSGNMDVGIAKRDGTAMTKVVGTGSTPMPVAAHGQVTVPTTRLLPGRYYVYVEADNPTARFNVAGIDGAGYMLDARLSTTGAFPHPDTPVSTVGWNRLLQATVQP